MASTTFGTTRHPAPHDAGDGPAAAPEPRNAESAGTTGAVAGLLTLHAATLVAAFTRTEPYPPLGVVPLIATFVAIGIMACVMVRERARGGIALAALFATASLISFGPHKLFTEGMPAIAPAVLAGMAFEIVILVAAARRLTGGRR